MKNLKFYLLIFTISSSVILFSFTFLQKKEVQGKYLFKKFISNFDKAELPYNVAISTISVDGEHIEENETISSDKLIPHSFGVFISGLPRSKYTRGSPNRYYFKDVIYENDDFVLVIYVTKSYRNSYKILNPNIINEYIVASYRKGRNVKDDDRLISLKTIVAYGLNQVSKSMISEDLVIKTEVRYTNEAKSTANKVKFSKITQTESYKITGEGKIEKVITKKVLEEK